MASSPATELAAIRTGNAERLAGGYKGLASLPLDRLAAALKEDADKRLRDLSARGIDVRHTFVMLISNYESLKEDGHKPMAAPLLNIEQVRISAPVTARVPYCLVATGAQPRSK